MESKLFLQFQALFLSTTTCSATFWCDQWGPTVSNRFNLSFFVQFVLELYLYWLCFFDEYYNGCCSSCLCGLDRGQLFQYWPRSIGESFVEIFNYFPQTVKTHLFLVLIWKSVLNSNTSQIFKRASPRTTRKSLDSINCIRWSENFLVHIEYISLVNPNHSSMNSCQQLR